MQCSSTELNTKVPYSKSYSLLPGNEIYPAITLNRNHPAFIPDPVQYACNDFFSPKILLN